MRDNRSYLNIKAGAIQRYLIWHYMGSVTNHIRVTEFPKSGGTWLCQMLSELLELQFPRNQAMTMKKGIMHSHYPGPVGEKKTILLIRDGRDIIVSAYHHFIIGHDLNPSFLVDTWRKRLGVEDYRNVEKHLPTFIDLFFTEFKVGGRTMNWSNYISSFNLGNSDLYVVRYEELLDNCFEAMTSLLQWLDYKTIDRDKLEMVIEKNAFKSITGREAGDEDRSQFLRKGISGDWKNYFSKEAEERFVKWASPQLKLLGYN